MSFNNFYQPYPTYQQPGYYAPPVPDQLAQLRQQQMQQQYQQPTQPVQQAAPQPQNSALATAMTPPTIHAEIVQVDGETAATQYPVGIGMSQMMIARDDSAIFVKTATANGYTLDVFDKRPPAPQPVPFNPDEYVRLSALPELVAAEVQAAVAAMQPAKTTRSKKETEAAE